MGNNDDIYNRVLEEIDEVQEEKSICSWAVSLPYLFLLHVSYEIS